MHLEGGRLGSFGGGGHSNLVGARAQVRVIKRYESTSEARPELTKLVFSGSVKLEAWTEVLGVV